MSQLRSHLQPEVSKPPFRDTDSLERAEIILVDIELDRPKVTIGLVAGQMT